MNIAVVGTGYVGLVSGTCFAELGNTVVCVDVDKQKIRNLQRGILPIYEPGLEELLSKNVEAGRLRFTVDLAEALEECETVFVCVGTPQRDDGSPKLDYVWEVAAQIRELAQSEKLVVVKSTVPVGTNHELGQRLNHGGCIQHETASNPEFLKEGKAISDFMLPDRVVVGVHNDAVASRLKLLYSPIVTEDRPFLVMTPTSAEMTKYVANSVLATKISFINDIANVCESVGAHIEDVQQGIGYDRRIGFEFLNPGPGYGGSCFPKDVRAMMCLAESAGRRLRILEAVDRINEDQKSRALVKLRELLGNDLQSCKVAVWGLAFKPGTDDIREAPSLVLIRDLVECGAQVQVHDFAAMDNVKSLFGSSIVYCASPLEAVFDTDALVVLTDWEEYREANLDLVYQLLRQPNVVDMRNMYPIEELESRGFTYQSVGRPSSNAVQDRCANLVA